MTNREEMDTMRTVLKHLKNKNQDNEFTVDENGQVLLLGKCYQHHEIRLIRTYRFEGESDPEEEAIIYLIEAADGTVGYSIDTYGIYTNHLTDGYASLIKKLAAVVH
jgi:hypothetical protein